MGRNQIKRDAALDAWANEEFQDLNSELYPSLKLFIFVYELNWWVILTFLIFKILNFGNIEISFNPFHFGILLSQWY